MFPFLTKVFARFKEAFVPQKVKEIQREKDSDYAGICLKTDDCRTAIAI